MSEQIPEVGDVWEHKQQKGYRIYILMELPCKGDVEVLRKIGSIAFDKSLIKEDFKYIGKSKANINQLFEVQDERKD